MKNIERILGLHLPEKQSAFLWGPRKTGKSTDLRLAFPNSLVFDYQQTDLTLEFMKQPSLPRQQIVAQDEKILRHPIVLDEVQKVRRLLGEGRVAIEGKGQSRVERRDMRSLTAFVDECSPRTAIVVCNEKAERVAGKSRVMPWRKFLSDLWQGRIISS